MKRLLASTLLGALVAHGAPAAAQRLGPDGETTLPKELEGIRIDDRPGAVVPRDLAFRDQDGRAVTLGDYIDGERPVLLVLAYYQCPMLCSIVLNGVLAGLKDVAWGVGTEYRVVTVSIDPRDTPELASGKRAAYVGSYGRPLPERGWDFLVGDAAASRALADAVGFAYRWDEERKEFLHAAGAFVLTPDGRVARTLYGITFAGRDLRLALVEASAGRLGSALDRLLLLCAHYDSQDGAYTVAIMRIVRFLGVLTVLVLGVFLARWWRRERRGRVEQATSS